MISTIDVQEIINAQSKSENTKCIRIPFWLNAESEPVFCWLHLPKSQSIQSNGLIICNPLGYEYSHCHRTLRHVADAAAQAGQVCLRFDYHGTGDSFSDIFDAERIKTFHENIGHAVQYLQQKLSISQINLLGLRLGATLAAGFSSNTEIENLILWSPIIKGKSYVREMKALEKLATHSTKGLQDDNTIIDSGGFILTENTVDELSRINLFNCAPKVRNKILIIERDDMMPPPRLIDYFESQNLNVESFSMQGYIEMMAEPQSNLVPNETISKIIDWLEVDTKTNHTDFDSNALFAVSASSNKETYIEQVCVDTDSGLFGVLTQSKDSDKSKPVILLVNSGSVHHVGPNRVYTELSRDIAAAGFNCLRFDLSNLGDSVQGNPGNENHPYPGNATKDITTMCNFLRSRKIADKIILVGLCSGSHNVFHAALSNSQALDISEIILINPLAFYRDPDGDFDLPGSFGVDWDSQHYSRSVLKSSSWKKLISGKVNLLYLSKFLYLKAFDISKDALKKIFEPIGLYPKDKLEKDILALSKELSRIVFFIASRDPGKSIIMSRAGKIANKLIKDKKIYIFEIENADHTFSSFSCRKLFRKTFVKYLSKYY